MGELGVLKGPCLLSTHGFFDTGYSNSTSRQEKDMPISVIGIRKGQKGVLGGSHIVYP